MITKLEYRDNIRADIVGGGSFYDWRLNSIYDADKTGTGHQPLWHDQYQAIYSKYRVFACKYELKFVLINGSSPCEVVAFSTPAISPTTSIDEAREQNRTTNKVVPADPSNVTVLRGNINLSKLRGETRTGFIGDELNSAAFGNNPLNTATLRLLMRTFDQNASSFAVTSKLVYYVELYDRVNPLTS